MEVWDYTVDMDMFRRVGARAFQQCEAQDPQPVRYGRLGVTMVRCGGAAMRGVTWQGVEDRHSKLLCDGHSLAWLGPRSDR